MIFEPERIARAAVSTVLLFAHGLGAQGFAPSAAALPSDAEIRALLADRVDVQQKSVGIVVGIITPEGRRIVSHGRLNQGDARPLDGDTVFEIGSVTKIFTSLLLADMVRRGEVKLTDPVALHLPAGAKVPERNGRKITLADLATHTSGLPFAPPDFPVRDPARYGAYGDDQLDRFLATHVLARDPGSEWAYSNLGMGLLGKALTHRAKTDFETLLRSRVTAPLGMSSTGITVSPAMKARLCVGHDAKLEAAPDWVLPVFAAAGSLRSTANDLLAFLAAFMGHKESALAPAMAAMLELRRPGPNLSQALGWWIIPLSPDDPGIVTHGGETFGYACTVAYDPRTRVGVVVLSNAAQNDGGLAWHLLRPAFPYSTSAEDKARTARKAIAVDAKVLDLRAGQYQPATGGPITIEREGDALVFKSSVVPQGLRLHAESERAFFVTEADLQVTFEADGEGRATALIVQFAGTSTRAPRVEVVRSGGGAR